MEKHSDTYGGLLNRGAAFLEEKGIKEGKLDAWYLFSHCFSMDRARYLLEAPERIPGDRAGEAAAFLKLVEKRGARIPLQQILGSQAFMGLDFFVNASVLIPRQDTETLVECVLEDIKKDGISEKREEIEILDLCTGSGCIGLSLAAYLPEYTKKDFQVTLSDISPDAILVAEKNRQSLSLEKTCRIVQSDLFAELGGKTFDIIVSNPPYIPSEVIRGLEPEVRDHEPVLALDGHEDGLYFYRRISGAAMAHLKTPGRIYVEIGCDQGIQVKALFENAGFGSVVIIKDLTGKDRVVKAVR